MRRSLHIASFLAFALTDLGLAGFAVWHDRVRTMDTARLLLDGTAHMLAEHAARSIEAGDSLLLTVAELASRWDFAGPDEGARIHRMMVEQVSRLPQVASVWLVDGNGRTVVENWGYPVTHSTGDMRGRPYFQAHVTGGADLFIGDPRPGTVTGKDRFTLSRAVRSPDGAFRGVVVTGVFADYFTRVSSSSGLPQGGRFTLTATDGTVLARHLDEEVEGPEIRVVEQVDGWPMTVTVSVPEATVLREWRARCLGVFWVAVGALAGFGALTWLGLKSARAEDAAKRGLEAEVARRTGELRDALAAARDANEAKVKFIAEVSHDLRQPLQGTSLFIDVALAANDDPRLAKLGAMCAENLEFGRRLLDELLTFAKLDAGVMTAEPTPFPLVSIFECVVESVRGMAERKGIELRWVPTGEWVVSDPSRLRQMVENLAVNAVKFTAHGKVLIGARPRGGTVVIEVWDTGIGIPPDQLGRIFQEFHQVAPGAGEGGGKGVGLGLSIVDRAARLLGHGLSVRSWPGRGTVFSITAPRSARVQSSTEPAAVCR